MDLSLLLEVARSENPWVYFWEPWPADQPFLRPIFIWNVTFIEKLFGTSEAAKQSAGIFYLFTILLLTFSIFSSLARNYRLGLITMLLYGCSFLQVHNVIYVHNQPHLIATLFTLAAFRLLISHTETRHKSYSIFSLLFALLAIVTSTAAVTFPFLAFLYFKYWKEWDLKRSLMNTLPFLSLIVVYMAFRAFCIKALMGDHTVELSLLEYWELPFAMLINWFHNFLSTFGAVNFPTPFPIHPELAKIRESFPLWRTPVPYYRVLRFFLEITLLTGFFATSFQAIRHLSQDLKQKLWGTSERRLVIFGLFWILIANLPYIHQGGPRFLSLSSLGACLITALLIWRVQKTKYDTKGENIRQTTRLWIKGQVFFLSLLLLLSFIRIFYADSFELTPLELSPPFLKVLR